MAGEVGTLVDDVVERLVKRFSLTPIAVDRFQSIRSRFELRLHRDLGTLHIRSTPVDAPAWELIFRGIGSARNWFTAEISTPDALDTAALSLLHDIDLALDGMLRRALLARQTLLARRRDALVRTGRSILNEHAALQRLDHMLDRFARQHERYPVSEVFGDPNSLRDQWLAIPDYRATSWPERWRASELAVAGSPNEGFRFYLECVMHASSIEEAAQYLAGELASAMHDGLFSASIEPIDPSGEFVDDQLRAFFDVVLDARDDTDTRSVPAASSLQIAMERLGA
jgi:hypothetical protein